MNGTILSGNLKKLRLENQYTQEQAAKLLNVSSQSVSRWECGNTLPEVTLLPQIARVYAVTVDDLFREDCCAYPNYAQRLLAVYEASGRIEDFFAARREFEKLLASGSETSDDLRGYGILYQYLMNRAGEEALHWFDRVLDRAEMDDVYYSTWRQKITLLAQTGRAGEAVTIHEQALSHDRENPHQWILLTAANLAAGDYERAYDTVREALEKFPKEGLLHTYAGDICRSLHRYDEAFTHWRSALDLDSSILDARYAMAACWEELGEYEKAFETWTSLAAELEEKGFEAEKGYPMQMARTCREKM